MFEITRKELLLLIRDRRAIVTLLVFPLVFIAIIGVSTGELLSGDNDNQKIKLGIVNLDGGELSGELIQEIQSKKGFIVSQHQTRNDATIALGNSEIRIAMIIGNDFQERVDTIKLSSLMDPSLGTLSDGLEGLDIEVGGRPSLDRMLPLVREVVFALTVQTLSPYVAEKDNRAKTILRIARRKASEREAELEKEAELTDEPEESEGAVYQEIVPMYTVLFVFFMMNIMARSFISERESGTFRRLLLSPISLLSLFLGKTIPFLLLSLMQTMLLFVAGRLLFGMTWGPQPLLLLPVMFCTSLAATGLGLLIASLVRTESQVSAYSTFLVMVMGGISGCFMPRNWMPAAMQQVSLITPHAWALIGYDQLLNTETPQLTVLWQACGVLFLFGAVFIAAGTLLFRPAE